MRQIATRLHLRRRPRTAAKANDLASLCPHYRRIHHGSKELSVHLRQIPFDLRDFGTILRGGNGHAQDARRRMAPWHGCGGARSGSRQPHPPPNTAIERSRTRTSSADSPGLRGQQHDTRSRHLPHRQRAAASPPLLVLAFFIGQGDWSCAPHGLILLHEDRHGNRLAVSYS